MEGQSNTSRAAFYHLHLAIIHLLQKNADLNLDFTSTLRSVVRERNTFGLSCNFLFFLDLMNKYRDHKHVKPSISGHIRQIQQRVINTMKRNFNQRRLSTFMIL